MTDSVRYITLGRDCSPAAALRNLHLREFALPFDWVQVEPHQLCNIITNDFKEYHDNLVFYGSRIRDGYGVYFPHDYPTIEHKELYINEEADGGGIVEKTIVADWRTHIPVIQEKYARRIERFHSILSSTAPIIALIACRVHDIPLIRDTFLKRYNKQNIVYVIATNDQTSDPQIVTCMPHVNGEWNNTSVWGEAISRAKEIIARSTL
jgi:hypothetical protein